MSERAAAEWREAVKDIGIAGIYDEFSSAGDTIRQLGHYINQAHGALPNHRDGNTLADEIRDLRTLLEDALHGPRASDSPDREGPVRRCHDCAEPGKCAVMDCGWAAAIKHYGWTLGELSARDPAAEPVEGEKAGCTTECLNCGGAIVADEFELKPRTALSADEVHTFLNEINLIARRASLRLRLERDS